MDNLDVNERLDAPAVAGRRFTRSRTARVGPPFVPELLQLSVVLLDACILLSVASLMYAFGGIFPRLGPDQFTFGALAAAIVTILVQANMGLYRMDALLEPRRNLWRVVLGCVLSFVVVGLAIRALRVGPVLAQPWLLHLFLASTTAICAGRLAFTTAVATASRRGLFSRNVVVIGAGPWGSRMVQLLEECERPWTRILGVFEHCERGELKARPQRVRDYPVLGNTQDLITFARRIRVDEIFVALPWSEAYRIEEVLDAVRVVPANVHLGPQTLGLGLAERKFADLDGIPVVSVATKPVSGWGLFLKWMLDKSVAVVALTLLSPLLIAVAVAIRLDSPGPIFFRQKRYGFNNKLIGVFKFRTMYHHMTDHRAEKLATRDDPRVTRVGRILRRTSIDELPQLINVLKGDMSIVGPRPHATNAKAGTLLYQDVVAEYACRHRIKPGITGWAQLHGWRGETDTEIKIIKRVEHDFYYIDNWSIALDLYIIVATALTLPFQKNAF
jgi:Undecaprenyl-phosphate glucose phosphotransferase